MKILVDPDSVPMSLEECIDNIRTFLEEQDINEIKAFKTNPFAKEKIGAAIFLKDTWSLTDDDNRLVKWFDETHGITNADQISALILHCLFCDLKEIPRRESEMAEKFRKTKKKTRII
jgi:hypothetical protein